MARYARPDAAGICLWASFSPSLLTRRLLEVIACGGPRPRKNDKEPASLRPVPGRRGRLIELLQADPSESSSDEEADAEAQLKVEAFQELQRVVDRLQLHGSNACGDRKGEAAAEVRRLSKDDPEARETLAMLGAIPPLVALLDSQDSDDQTDALYALLNLGIGNELNKAAIVKAGAIHKMLSLIDSGPSQAVSEAIVANFLGLSALDSNKPVIGALGAIPFLLSAFRSCASSPTAKQDALRALFNLSIASANLPLLIDSGLVSALLASIGDMEVSERALAVLSNLVSSSKGRRAVARCTTDSFAVLVDVLWWSDAAACQEKAVYVLMVMAHKGHGSRAAMIGAGVISSLLELTLLGTPLAQKRASRLLEILTGDKGKGMSEEGSSSCISSVSAPQWRAASAEANTEEGMSEEKKAVKDLVQQSLQSNMQRIVRRANLAQDFAPSERFRALTAACTSKSLPF
ncbi:U-box domain-containing protein 12-like [Zingiber officinale]|uniref:Uncharacterized protein n=1 Tax=Zingiber officinale TaxID=94328 RepID=A0A8J5EUC7_ZINOF|nr:U-box domain-containing protein 12-like [Zingiber officinale]KAG6472536.1 hypothetical protein ZIOFF_070002 [Zingiber officinale]